MKYNVTQIECPICGTINEISGYLSENYVHTCDRCDNYIFQEGYEDLLNDELKLLGRGYYEDVEKASKEDIEDITGPGDYFVFSIRLLSELSKEEVSKFFTDLENTEVFFMKKISYGETILSDILDSSEGINLTKSLNLNIKDMEEYRLEIHFFEKLSKRPEILSYILRQFPLCIIREENSSVTMTSNKRIAKGLSDYVEEEGGFIPVLPNFLTSWEKYGIIYDWVRNYSPDAILNDNPSNIYIKGAKDKLVPFTVFSDYNLLNQSGFLEYIAEEKEINISPSNNVTYVKDFASMLEDIVDADDDYAKQLETLRICSLRGGEAFLAKIEKGEVK